MTAIETVILVVVTFICGAGVTWRAWSEVRLARRTEAELQRLGASLESLKTTAEELERRTAASMTEEQVSTAVAIRPRVGELEVIEPRLFDDRHLVVYRRYRVSRPSLSYYLLQAASDYDYAVKTLRAATVVASATWEWTEPRHSRSARDPHLDGWSNVWVTTFEGETPDVTAPVPTQSGSVGWVARIA